jgi:hypothetical protein
MRRRDLIRHRRNLRRGIAAVAWLKDNQRRLGLTMREQAGFALHLRGLLPAFPLTYHGIPIVYDDQMPEGTCYALNMDLIAPAVKQRWAQRAFYGMSSLFPLEPKRRRQKTKKGPRR